MCQRIYNNGDGNPADPAAVDITIDFDLSKSLVLEGSEYKLKPVLHIVETADAATIEGFIDNSLFPLDGLGYVEITVFDRTDQQQEYTTIKVVKDDNATDEMTAYSVFWLVPNQSYTVKINYNPGLDDDPNAAGIQDGYDKSVTVPDPSDLDYPEDTLPPGDIYWLDFSPPPTT